MRRASALLAGWPARRRLSPSSTRSARLLIAKRVRSKNSGRAAGGLISLRLSSERRPCSPALALRLQFSSPPSPQASPPPPSTTLCPPLLVFPRQFCRALCVSSRSAVCVRGRSALARLGKRVRQSRHSNISFALVGRPIPGRCRSASAWQQSRRPATRTSGIAARVRPAPDGPHPW